MNKNLYTSKKMKPILLTLAALGISLAASGCNESSQQGKSGDLISREPEPTPKTSSAEVPPDAEAVPEDTPSPDVAPEPSDSELGEIGLSLAESRGARMECWDQLASAIYKGTDGGFSDTAKHTLVEQLCALPEKDFTDRVEWFSQGEAAKKSSQYLLSLGFDRPVSPYNRREASDVVLKWKATNCTEGSSIGAQDFEHVALGELGESEAVESWRQCLAQTSKGLVCESSEVGDQVMFRVWWTPTAGQKVVVSSLEAKLGLSSNLEFSNSPLVIPPNEDVWISADRTSPKDLSTFDLRATAFEGRFSLACSIETRRPVHGTYRRHESCGIARYNTRRDASCGAEEYAYGRGAVCGVESYKQARSEACGVERYNSEASRHCPGYVAPTTVDLKSESSGCSEASDPAPCAQGFADQGLTTKLRFCGFTPKVVEKTRRCVRPERLGTCELPRFGVKSYKSCRHPSHGVDFYGYCSHPSFGVSLYKECSRPEFGAVYKTCFVPDF